MQWLLGLRLAFFYANKKARSLKKYKSDNISNLKKQPLHFPNDEGLPQTSSYSQSNRNNHGHSRKYSSASTLAIHEGCSSLEAFEQLVKKYNLFVYLPHIEPPPGYEESNSYPVSGATRQSNSGENSNSINSTERESQERNFDFGFRETTVQMEDAITIERQGRGGAIETVADVCGVPARLTGFFSLVTQTITLIISCGLTILFLLHIGGYDYFSEIVTNTIGNETFLTNTNSAVMPNMISINESFVDIQDEVYNLLNRQNQSDLVNTLLDSNGSSTSVPKAYQGPLGKIQDAQLELFGIDWDLLSILRALGSLYVVVCVIWLISIICLLLSLKLEILDFVCINAFFLTIAFIFQLCLAILICVLLFYHQEIDSTLYLIAGTVGGLLLCFLFGIVALIMVSGWYKYIDYMNGSEDTCLCTSAIVRLIKRNKRPSRGTNSTDYSIPEATRHANLPYIDETPVQQFSNF